VSVSAIILSFAPPKCWYLGSRIPMAGTLFWGFSGIPVTGIAFRVALPEIEKIEGVRHTVSLMISHSVFCWVSAAPLWQVLCAPPRNGRNGTHNSAHNFSFFFGFSGIPLTRIFCVPHPEIEGMIHTIPLISFLGRGFPRHPRYKHLPCAPPRNKRNQITLFRFIFFFVGCFQRHPCYRNLSCAPPRNLRNEITLFRLCFILGGGGFSGIPVTGIFCVPHLEIEGMRHTIPLMLFFLGGECSVASLL